MAGADPGVAPFTADQVRRLRPQLYLATAEGGSTLQGLRTTRWRRLAPIRSGRFAVLGREFLEPGPHLALALRRLAAILHPPGR